jgi:hypothetical protein
MRSTSAVPLAVTHAEVASNAIAHGAAETLIVATRRSPSGVLVATGTGVGGREAAAVGGALAPGVAATIGEGEGAPDGDAVPHAVRTPARRQAAIARSAGPEREVGSMGDTARDVWIDRKGQFAPDR